ncbi:MAG: PKHD-type hydroxylase, partial [Gammaproteobacteria bacterium]
MMLHIPNVLTHEQVGAMRAALARADWTDGRETVGAQGAQVKRNRQLPQASPVCRELGEQVLAALSANALYFAAALPLRTSTPLFNAYAGGETYGDHID